MPDNENEITRIRNGAKLLKINEIPDLKDSLPPHAKCNFKATNPKSENCDNHNDYEMSLQNTPAGEDSSTSVSQPRYKKVKLELFPDHDKLKASRNETSDHVEENDRLEETVPKKVYKKCKMVTRTRKMLHRETITATPENNCRSEDKPMSESHARRVGKKRVRPSTIRSTKENRIHVDGPGIDLRDRTSQVSFRCTNIMCQRYNISHFCLPNG